MGWRDELAENWERLKDMRDEQERPERKHLGTAGVLAALVVIAVGVAAMVYAFDAVFSSMG